MLSWAAELRKFWIIEILILFCSKTHANLDLLLNTQTNRAKGAKTLAFSHLQRSSL